MKSFAFIESPKRCLKYASTRNFHHEIDNIVKHFEILKKKKKNMGVGLRRKSR